MGTAVGRTVSGCLVWCLEVLFFAATLAIVRTLLGRHASGLHPFRVDHGRDLLVRCASPDAMCCTNWHLELEPTAKPRHQLTRKVSTSMSVLCLW